MRVRFIAIVLSLTAFACGVPQEEHDKALADQKAAFDAQMKKMQEGNANELKARDNSIGELRTEVKNLGGNLAEVEARAAQLNKTLGAKQAELATTKTELQSKEGKLQATEGQLAATQAELEQVRKLREQAEAAAAAFKSVASKLQSMVDAGKLQVIVRKGRMTLKLPDNILFPAGKTKLKKDGKAALESVAEVLKTVEGRDFLIAGHTDNIPIRSRRYKSNWDLSTARAVRVVKLMIEAGVPPERVAAAGFGEFDPVESNETKEGRAANRRLEIILMPKLSELPQLPSATKSGAAGMGKKG